MDRLYKDHEDLRAAMQRFAALLARGHDAAAADLLRERVAFSQLLTRHRADEEAEIGATIQDAPLAAALAADMQAILRDYSAHIGAWSPSRIPAEWDAYVAATLALQQRLRLRLAWEERALFPQLAAG